MEFFFHQSERKFQITRSVDAIKFVLFHQTGGYIGETKAGLEEDQTGSVQWNAIYPRFY